MKKNILMVTIVALLLVGCGGVSAQESNEQGILLYEQENYVDALKKFNQAISQDKDEAIFYANRGMAFFLFQMKLKKQLLILKKQLHLKKIV